MDSDTFRSRVRGRREAISTLLHFEPLDPYAVRIEFHDRTTVEWMVGRDLLLAGLGSQCWVGEGDVAVRRHRDDRRLELALSSPRGAGVLQLPVVPVARFLGRTLLALPAGTEAVPDSAFTTLLPPAA